MRYRAATLLVTMWVGSCARLPPERQVIADTAAALGGNDRIEAIQTISFEGEGSAAMAGQNTTPDAELPVWKVTAFRRTINLASGRMRTEQMRTAQFLFAGPTTQRLDQGLDGDVAYEVAPNGSPVRASNQVARERYLEMLQHPIAVVRAALDPASKIENLRQQGQQQLVDIVTAKGGKVTLAVDGTTRLPVREIVMADNPNLGDVAIVTTFADYEDVSGLKAPKRIATTMDKYPQFELKIRKTTVNTASVVAAPDAVRAAPPPPPLAMVVTAQPMAKGIWWLAGSGSHRSVVFEFGDHLTLFEAPLNEARTKAVIDKARTLSSKPLTEVIVSHHHFDHSGGLRVAVAEGLKVITYRGNEAFFKDLLARPHRIVPDELQMNPKPATFVFVDDQMVLKDSALEVRLYHLLDNPREGTNLFAYVPRDRILVQADLYDSTWQQHLWGENVLWNIRHRELKVDKDVPVHGSVEPFAQMVGTIKEKPTIPTS